MSETKQANRLINESSPYLLQHAHNPVDWFPWGEEALQKAKEEDKPIILSIGYSSCHWCHVMERESFEDEETAALMNEHFVSIKVDREERPDLDQIYMDAIQALTGSGGWPLNVFLLPDTRPFYGGTYFPPRTYQNMPSWTQLLNGISKTFRDKRDELEEQANKITEHIKGMDTMLIKDQLEEDEASSAFEKEDLQAVYEALTRTFDQQKGGFSTAPKFPNTMNIDFLFRYGRLQGEQGAMDHGLFTLRQMMAGGIYDQIGGGFARYSTDPDWLVPHFEKMLYDNGLIISTFADAYKITKDEDFAEVIHDSLSFIEREMTSEEGGFYSALDADSEGEEGKYYVWGEDEIDDLLGDDAPLFKEFYDVTGGGNWEGTNILHRTEHYKAFADRKGMSVDALKEQLLKNKKTLLRARQQRIRPGLDDKILLAWNALMATAYVKAYTALGVDHYRKMANNNLTFLLQAFKSADQPGLYHNYKEGEAHQSAFLDDYAFLIQALLDYYFATFDEAKLEEAIELAGYVVQNFTDNNTGLFYYTIEGQLDVLFRKKDLFDNAIPSGNAVMALNLQKLGTVKGDFDYLKQAETMLQRVWPTLAKYPSGFGQWNQLLLNFVYPLPEIAVVGNDYSEKSLQLQQEFITDYVIMGADDANGSTYPLLENKNGEQKAYIYVCQNYSCKQPVQEVNKALQQINGG